MNPFYSNPPDIKKPVHIDLFVNRDEELFFLKEWLLAEKTNESIGAVIGQPRIGKSHLCYKALADLEKDNHSEYILINANHIEHLSNLLFELYRFITEKIKNIPADLYEKNETQKAFYDCLCEDISHYNELLTVAVDTITCEVLVEKGEALKSKLQTNIEGTLETGIKLFIKSTLNLKTLVGYEREKSTGKSETKTHTVVYRKPDNQGMVDIINDFIRGYSILIGEKRLFLYIDDLDRITRDIKENDHLISELIYCLKKLSLRNPNLLIFASISESFYNASKEKFFRLIRLLRPMKTENLMEIYKRRCDFYAIQFIPHEATTQLAAVFKGSPGRFLDALDKFYMDRGRLPMKEFKDILAYLRNEIDELENGTRSSITGLKQILENKVKKSIYDISQDDFGANLDLFRTPLVGEILYEAPLSPGKYQINPMYYEALKQ